MSKMIAVWGSPYSGKTTMAVKMAKVINEHTDLSVAVVCVDDMTPTLPVLFPYNKSEEMFSIGTILSKPEITLDDILKNMVVTKNKSNIGFIGFKDCENQYSYPTFSKEKIETFFVLMKELVDVVIVDCSSYIKSPLTEVALMKADAVVRMVTPTANSISFFSSQLPILNDPKYKCNQHFICMTIPDNGVFNPVNEAISYYKNIEVTFYHCEALKLQYIKGVLLDNIADKKFDKSFKLFIDKVVELCSK